MPLLPCYSKSIFGSSRGSQSYLKWNASPTFAACSIPETITGRSPTLNGMPLLPGFSPEHFTDIELVAVLP
ncbi:MAG: hypothetical protein MRZ79_21915 [Bacteroidia bacterium]|nr:hypothetical protein [Bacteroidia bacterium]